MLHEWRRSRQRDLEVHGWRRDLDPHQGRRPRSAARTHRAGRVPEAAEHSLCADRGTGRGRRRARRTWRTRRRRRRRTGSGSRSRRRTGSPASGSRAERSASCASSRAAAGWRRAPRTRRRPRHQPGRERVLSLGRRGRDMAQGEQREPAAHVFQQGSHRSERSRDRLSRRRRPAPDARWRPDDGDRRRGIDA